MSGSTPQNEREDENAGEAKTPQAEMEAEATELVDKALDAMRIASSIVPEFWLGGSRAQKTRPRKSTLSRPLLKRYFQGLGFSQLGADVWTELLISGCSQYERSELLKGIVTSLHDNTQFEQLVDRVRRSPLFDEVFYCDQAGLNTKDLDPAIHYLLAGEPLGLSPSLLFDSDHYARRNPDVFNAGKNCLLHYEEFGQREGRQPTIWFDQGWYSTQYGGNATYDYNHFITRGAAQGSLPSALVEHIMRSFWSDASFTLQIYDSFVEASANWPVQIPPTSVWLLTGLFVPEWHDRAATPLEAFLAYLRDGLFTGKTPGPLFDAAVYRRRAATADLPPCSPDESAIVHWLLHGHAARIVPTDRFDELYYRGSNPDLDSSPDWGFAHFFQHGVREGRLPKPQHTFYRPHGAQSQGDGRLPKLYHQWHILDFPNQVRALADDIPAAYERRLEELFHSEQLTRTFAAAQAIDPNIGEASSITEIYLPPFHDGMTLARAEVRHRIPATHYDSILCVPWVRTGGADLVAGLLAKALLRVRPAERVLVLRTDHPHFERGNWLPAEADCVDISDLTTGLPPSAAENLLRVLFRGVTAQRVFNVNSRLCWTTLRDHGANLAATLRTYAYMFCWDQTVSGRRVGYPAEFFAETAGSITAFLTDTVYLRNELAKMYQLPTSVGDRIVPIFTPARTLLQTPSIARVVLDRAAPGSRRLVLWAGRLDRQKRFDLVQDIARSMPDVEFRCWGTALLDAPPDLSRLPANVTMQPSFDSFDDLPLADAGAWLFTSLWEGMPTTIIELAARGMPVVASAVGGVPELIQPDTGWPVPTEADIDDYVAALRDALSSPEEAVRRAEALQRRVSSIYTETRYDATLDALLAAEEKP